MSVLWHSFRRWSSQRPRATGPGLRDSFAIGRGQRLAAWRGSSTMGGAIRMRGKVGYAIADVGGGRRREVGRWQPKAGARRTRTSGVVAVLLAFATARWGPGLGLVERAVRFRYQAWEGGVLASPGDVFHEPRSGLESLTRRETRWLGNSPHRNGVAAVVRRTVAGAASDRACFSPGCNGRQEIGEERSSTSLTQTRPALLSQACRQVGIGVESAFTSKTPAGVARGSDAKFRSNRSRHGDRRE